MPAALITSSHLFCSDTMSLPNSAELIFTITPPCSSSLFWNAGNDSTSMVSAWKRAMMSGGVLGGAKMPHQMLDSYPVTVSAIVGTSGTYALRFAPPVAISRTRPLWMNGIMVTNEEICS